MMSMTYGIAVIDPRSTGKIEAVDVHWIHGVIGAFQQIGMYFLLFMSYYLTMFLFMAVFS